MPKITKAASNSDEINKAHNVQKPSMDKSSTNDVNETHLTQEFTQRCNLILPLPMIGLHESKHTKSTSSALSNQIETEISVKKSGEAATRRNLVHPENELVLEAASSASSTLLNSSKNSKDSTSKSSNLSNSSNTSEDDAYKSSNSSNLSSTSENMLKETVSMQH